MAKAKQRDLVSNKKPPKPKRDKVSNKKPFKFNMQNLPASNQREKRPALQVNNFEKDAPRGMPDVRSAKQADDDTIFGMDRDRFSQLAGALGSIIAPNTTMGNIGAAVSDFAGQRLARRQKLEREDEIWDRGAEQRRLDRELTQARIKEAGKLSKYERQVKNFMKANPGKTQWEAEEAIANLGKTEKTEKTRGFNMVDGKLMSGYWTEDGKFESLRLASPRELSIWKNESGMQGAGKFSKRILYDKYGNEMPVYSRKKYEELMATGNYTEIDKTASQKQQKTFVEDSMKAWIKGEGFDATPSQVTKQRAYYRLVFQTKRKADKGGWPTKHHPELGKVYIVTKDSKEYKRGDVVNMAGEKVSEIKKADMLGIPDVMGLSHKKAGETLTFPMPKRKAGE